MRDISELERVVIQWSAVPITFLIFGAVIPFTVASVEAAILTGYEKMKGNNREIRKLYDENIYKVLGR